MRRMMAASLVLLAIGVLRPELVTAQYADTPEPGQITFEQFRMLTRGMTEGQVLSKLGNPIAHTTLTCTAETTKDLTAARPRWSARSSGPTPCPKAGPPT